MVTTFTLINEYAYIPISVENIQLRRIGMMIDGHSILCQRKEKPDTIGKIENNEYVSYCWARGFDDENIKNKYNIEIIKMEEHEIFKIPIKNNLYKA